MISTPLQPIIKELLFSQEEHIQTFLLRTAFLPHFSASLCDAVLKRRDSQQILQHMERANLFLIAEDYDHRWYHYATPFAEALNSYLEQSESNIVPVLHRRAAQWYEQHDSDVPEPELPLPLPSPQDQEVRTETQQTSSSQPLLDPLSMREMEVLQLMAQGAPNSEIADHLVIALNTVKRHVSSILSKLGTANRTQAVAQARNLGII
jgi:ATP/maltotriose-dependent transcriptional regulator MalT